MVVGAQRGSWGHSEAAQQERGLQQKDATTADQQCNGKGVGGSWTPACWTALAFPPHHRSLPPCDRMMRPCPLPEGSRALPQRQSTLPHPTGIGLGHMTCVR